MGAYDPQVYFVASRDKQGHNSSLRVSVPTGVMQDIAELVASRRIGHLKTPSDCFRDALGRWLEWMTKEGGAEELEASSALYNINLEMDKAYELREFNKATLVKIEKLLQDASTPQEIALARSRAAAAAQAMEDEAYRFQVEQIIERWGH